MKCINKTKNIQVSAEVYLADNFFSRLKGLMFKSGLKKGEGLLIKQCKQVHTFFMKFDIDVVFLDKSGKAVYIAQNMGGRKISKWILKACDALEFEAGYSAGRIELGDEIEFLR